MPSSSICLFVFFFSLLSIHSSFSNTTRQIKWKNENFRIIKIELLLHTKKRRYFISSAQKRSYSILYFHERIYQVIVQMNNFFFSQNTKAIAINHFFSSIFCTSRFMYKYIRILSVEHTLNVNAEYKLILKMMILDCLTWCNFKGKI